MITSVTKRAVEPISTPPMSARELRYAVRTAPPDEAPGDDAVPIRVWRLLAEILNDTTNVLVFNSAVTSILDDCMRNGYNPRHFQSSATVTLRKGGPRKYEIIPACGLAGHFWQAAGSIIAVTISWVAEGKEVLPKGPLQDGKELRLITQFS